MTTNKVSVMPKISPKGAAKRLVGLQEIGGCNNANREGNVIFIHGLGGNARSTWHPKELQDDNNFWLYWLSQDQDLPDIGIWSFGYEAEPFDWKGKAMPLFDQASNLLEWIKSENISEKPLVFVTHSLGGLLVKETVRTAQTFKEKMLEQIKGIAFLATPHTGSHLANLISNIGALTRTTISVEELKAHSPQLRELNEWYRQNVRGFGIATKVYYETIPGGVHGVGVLVVDQDSANPGIEGVKPVAVLKNHITIAKPDSTDCLVYLGVKRFIQECFTPPQNGLLSQGEDDDEELKQVLNTLYSDKQSRNQPISRADLFCSLLRCRIDRVDSSKRNRVNDMLDDFDRRLAATSDGKFEVTDAVKDLLSKARIRAKEDGKDRLGVLQVMKVLLEDPGENIPTGLDRHGFTTAEILSEMTYRSSSIFTDGIATGSQQ